MQAVIYNFCVSQQKGKRSYLSKSTILSAKTTATKERDGDVECLEINSLEIGKEILTLRQVT